MFARKLMFCNVYNNTRKTDHICAKALPSVHAYVSSKVRGRNRGVLMSKGAFIYIHIYICIDPSLLNYAISTQIWPVYFQEFSWTDIANIYDASSFLGRLSGQSLQVRAEIVYIYFLY